MRNTSPVGSVVCWCGEWGVRLAQENRNPSYRLVRAEGSHSLLKGRVVREHLTLPCRRQLLLSSRLLHLWPNNPEHSSLTSLVPLIKPTHSPPSFGTSNMFSPENYASPPHHILSHSLAPAREGGPEKRRLAYVIHRQEWWAEGTHCGYVVGLKRGCVT